LAVGFGRQTIVPTRRTSIHVRTLDLDDRQQSLALECGGEPRGVPSAPEVRPGCNETVPERPQHLFRHGTRELGAC
jgi:hypothetical protein